MTEWSNVLILECASEEGSSQIVDTSHGASDTVSGLVTNTLNPRELFIDEKKWFWLIASGSACHQETVSGP